MRCDIYSKGDFPLINITNMGHSADAAVTRYNHGKRWLYIVHYVISGKGYFNGRQIQAGQGFLITPGMDEEYHPDEKNPWELLWIVSSDEGMGRLYPYFSADEESGIFTFDSHSEAKLLAAEIDENDRSFFTSAQMMEKFLRLFNSHSKDSGENSSAADHYFNFSVSYISINLHTGVKISNLTEILGITQVYLYKIFMQKTGKSPKQYIEDLKFKKAKKLLLETDSSISSIAASVGYDDPLSFSKFFLRRTGLFPQKYRASAKDRVD